MSHLKYWLTPLLLSVATITSGQWVQDECFYSVPTGADFESSELIRNTHHDHTDIVKFQDGAWSGVDNDVLNNLSIAPPVNCDASKAAFFRVLSTDTIGEGIGFRLSSPLQQGNSVSIEFTYVSHGYGSAGQFQPKIYSSDNGEFQVDGNITAQLITNMPAVGGEWETHTFSFTPTPLTAGHEWIFFYAPESSGLLMNMCQIETGSFEFTAEPQVNLCEGESVMIGQAFDPALDIDFSWSNGSTDAMISVSEGGLYTVNASNTCSQAVGTFLLLSMMNHTSTWSRTVCFCAKVKLKSFLELG